MSEKTLLKAKNLVPSASKFKIRSASIKQFSKEELLDAYRCMLTARRLDEKMLILLKQGKGHFHIGSSGHEAIQIAAAKSIVPGKDWALPYYRDMALAVGIGLTSRDLLSAHLSRVTDTSYGKQMPSHFNSSALRIVSVSSAIGAQYLPSVGVAQASRRRGTDEVTLVSLGDGGTSQGSFFEMINWASRDKIPLIVIVQDNKYAISTPVKHQTSHGSISRTVAGFENLEIIECDGTEYFNSVAAMQAAVKRARAGEGPTLVHAHTVRLLPHSSSDDHRKYRDEEDLERDKANDPIARLAEKLMDAGYATETELDILREEVKREIDEDTQWVLAQDEPKAEDGVRYMYSEKDLGLEYGRSVESGDPVVIVDAINHALHEEMDRDDKVLVFGQDVAGGKGGVFTATRGLTERFGYDRCYNSPLSETSIVGSACGLAIQGFKPVVEIQFGDYIWPAMQQLRNQVPSLRFRSHNQYGAPMVIRIPIGGYIHGGLCHSQNIESIMAHIPGFKIVMPSNAADAKGMLKTAIRSDDPILFLEHKALYRQGFARSPEPDSNYLVEIGSAKVVHEGDQLTVVTYGALVQKCINAAKEYAKIGLTVEVIDIRSIVPLDMQTISNSIKKTGRVLVAHEDLEFVGLGAEIAAQIADQCFTWLDAPVKRVAARYAYIPYATAMEDYVLPNDEDLREAMDVLLKF